LLEIAKEQNSVSSDLNWIKVKTNETKVAHLHGISSDLLLFAQPAEKSVELDFGCHAATNGALCAPPPSDGRRRRRRFCSSFFPLKIAPSDAIIRN